jgi:three-Cys-motif partner protein
MTRPKLDQIGYWSEVKLDIVREYATAYSIIMNKQPNIKKYAYIDAFAGAGTHISKQSGKMVPGSPLNALLIRPPFSEFHFIDLDGGRAAKLRQLTKDLANVTVHDGDCNEILLRNVFPLYRFEDYRRALCLLDPYGLDVDWKVLETAGKMRSIEIFYNFMIMDANMNILWRNPDRVAAQQKRRMDAVWGDHSWRQVAYKKTRGLFEDLEEKAENREVAEGFRKRLRENAGFNFVPEPIPMRNSTGTVIYYLFFASPNKTGEKIFKDIYNKYRQKGSR